MHTTDNKTITYIVTDQISLNATDLLPGDCNVTVGVYSPIDSLRLTTNSDKSDSSNTDHLTLHQLNVSP